MLICCVENHWAGSKNRSFSSKLTFDSNTAENARHKLNPSTLPIYLFIYVIKQTLLSLTSAKVVLHLLLLQSKLTSHHKHGCF